MILAIISTLAVFVALILVHELGHFLAAKKAGIKVEEFGIFFPPRLFSWKRGETTYAINLVPLGGYVKIFGEQGEHPDDPRSFAAKPLSRRMLVVSAGVLMNVILALAFFIWGFQVGMPTEVTAANEALLRDKSIRIVNVVPGSPAQKAGLSIGDKILTIDGQSFQDIETLQGFVERRGGEKLKVQVQRGKEVLNFTVLARSNPPAGEGAMGVALAKIGLQTKPFLEAVVAGVVETGRTIAGVIIGFYVMLATLVGEGKLIGEVAGPIGIASLFLQFYKLGLPFFLRFAGLLSVSLAVINAIPFPALDGGRLVFLAWEGIAGKKVPARIEQAIHVLGFTVLIFLILLITLQDLSRF